MPASNQSQIPAISTFQMDDGGASSLEKSVNQFRGDVGFQQKLLSLPGRPGKKHLDVELSILCQSNVSEQAKRWNLDGPTGILGLGWSLPTERIVMQDNGSTSPLTRTYSLEQNGSQNQLVREPGTPSLFSFPATAATALSDGQAIGTAVQAQFTDRGLLVDAAALAEAIPGTENWTIVDATHQQLFTLVRDGDQFVAHDGGEAYQLQSYQFWKILYYPRFERWLIIKPTGLMSSYGGLGAAPGGADAGAGKTSRGNSIEWGVRWGYSDDGREVGVWKGSSALTHFDGQAPQQQYATAWRLESISDRWGDRVAYAYNELEVGPGNVSTGLEAGSLAQKVGDESGLPYTKACYLTSITDVFGRRVLLRYGDKLYDDSSAAAPREYLDPHKDAPDNIPNGYQDRYETMYLDEIRVESETGAMLLGIDFEYAPRPGHGDASQVAASPVATVSGATGTLAGVTAKRFLTGIVERNPEGEALPGLRFDYYLDPDDANAGALKSITQPEGATATYTYASDAASTELDVCQRRVEIDPPAAAGDEPVPYAWFGPDYAVTLWVDTVRGVVTLRAYTWLGRWAGWQYTDDAVLYSDESRGVSDVEVIAKAGFFGVFLRTGSEGRLYVFQKDTSRAGLWQPMVLDGKPSLPIVYDLSQSDSSFDGGDSFLAVLLQNTVDDTSTLTAYTYRWPTRDWESHGWTGDGWASGSEGGGAAVIANADLYLAAGAEYLVTLSVEDGGESATLDLSYLDPTGHWHDAGQLSLGEVSVPQTEQYEPVAISPGASMVALSVKFLPDAQNMDTDLYLVQWDEGYRFLPVVHQSFQDHVESGGELPSATPEIAENSLVGCAGHLLRYNGMLGDGQTPQWLVNDALAESLDAAYNSVQHYAYGGEYGLQGVYQGVETPVARCLFYDPSTDVTTWSSSPRSLPVDIPSQDRLRERANWPTAGNGDYFTLGTRIYPRYGTAGTTFWTTDWASVATPPASVGGNLGSESAVDQAPGFICFLEQDDDGEYTEARAFLLENGAVSRQQTLAGEKYLTASEAQSSGRSIGAGPAGASSLVTYPSSAPSFDKAPKLFLYRWAGNALEGDIVHYPVQTVSIDDGFGHAVDTAYVFDVATATCDPTGQVVKYYSSSSYSGTADPAQSQQGSTAYEFINGYENTTGSSTIEMATYPPAPDSHRFDMLDGMQLSKTLYRHGDPPVEVAKTETSWKVYTEVNRNPASVDPKPLYGGFACRAAITKTTDGVPSQIEVDYVPKPLEAPYSGLPVQVSSSVVGVGGETETFTEAMTYGYEVSEAQYDCGEIFQALHLLSPRAATTSWRSVNGGAELAAAAKASTVTPWPATLGSTTIQLPATHSSFAFPGGAFSAFPFNTFKPGDEPAGWQLTSRTLERNAMGLPIETVNAAGIHSSLLYGSADDYLVAQFTNASLGAGEASYLGFESYEDASGWTLAGGARRVETDAHTGVASLELPTGASLSTTVTPARARPYLLSFFYKTSGGFTPQKGAGFEVIVRSGGQATGDPVEVAFSDTGGEATGGAWREVSAGIPLGSDLDPGQDLILEVTASQPSTGTVLLDDVRIVPRTSSFSATVYNATTRLSTAQLSLGAGTERTAHDTFLRNVVTSTTGTDGSDQVASILIPFLSRQGRADDVFDAQSPNANVQVAPTDGGRLETFRDGGAWQSRWQASPPADWQSGNGELRHTTASPGTLSWQAAPVDPSRGWAIYFELLPPSGAATSLAGQVGITFGERSVLWNASGDSESGGAWEFLANGSPVMAPLASPPAVARSWLLVQGRETVAFFADGQLIFSAPHAPDETPAVNITTGPNALTLRNLAAVAAPRLSITYADAAGRTIQSQHLCGADALADQTIYDSVGQAVAQTKAIPASYGSGAGVPVLAFRDTLVDVDAFLAVLDGSGKMSGDVANYYSSQNLNAPSDDGGYPYTRKRLEASPLARLIEEGQAGQRYAIQNPATTSPQSRSTTQYVYAANQGGTLPHGPALPAGSFRVETKISPAKVETSKLVDSLGRTAAQWKSSPDGTINTQSIMSTTFDENGRTTVTKLPNFFTSGPQENPQSFVTTSLSDPLGRLVKSTDPDAGTVRRMYDVLGRLRFVELNPSPPKTGSSCPAPPVQSGLLYYKYDALGRQIESGTCDFEWTASTAATLQAHAEDPTWPSAASQPPVSFEIARATAYDGDGSSPGALGQPSEITTLNHREIGGEPTTITVKETFDYLLNGEIHATTVLSDEATNNVPQTVTYAYNQAGQVVELTYPAGGAGTVTYAYNELGQVTAVGNATAPAAYASYAYRLDGAVASEQLDGGALHRTSAPTPPGWLAQTALSSTNRPGLSGLESYSYLVDGKIESYSRKITDNAMSGPFAAAYGYDAIDRFQSADVSSDANLSSSIPSGGYDDNGNIYTVSRGSGDGATTLELDYAPGLDLIDTVRRNGQESPVCWDANGRVVAAPQLGAATPTTHQLSYDQALGLTASVRVSSDDNSNNVNSKVVTFAYGMKNRRVLKRVDDGSSTESNAESNVESNVESRLYVHGPDGEVLAERTADGTVTSYLQGPGGLLALRTGAADLYYPLRDKSGSFYAVLDGSGKIAATYAYEAFGAVTASGPSPQILRYLYTGQEYDEELGLYNYKARLYDPWLARFYSPDPQHQFASPYVYAGNDPIRFTDPSGEFSWNALAAGLISGVEIIAGVATVLLTEGSGSVVGAALIGAGVSGVVSSVQNRDKKAGAIWSAWGKSEVIGAVGGLIAGGIGIGGAAGAKKLALSGFEAFAGQLATGMLAGAASSVGTQVLSIGMSQAGWGDEQSWSDLYSWTSLFGDLLSADLGALGGAVGWGLRKKLPGAKIWMMEDEPTLPDPMEVDAHGARKYPGPAHRVAGDDEIEWKLDEPQSQLSYTRDLGNANQDIREYNENMKRSKPARFLLVRGPGEITLNKAGVAGRIPLLAGPAALNSKRLFVISYHQLDPDRQS